MDMTIKSITKIFKNRTATIFLSGEEHEGEIGVQTILDNQGTALVLDPKNCLYKEMVNNIIDKFPANVIADEESLAAEITGIHFRFKDMAVTA